MAESRYERLMDGNRRNFLKMFAAGAAGLVGATLTGTGFARAAGSLETTSRVGFETGTDRREMIVSSLKPFENEIGTAIDGKKVLIKVNMGQVEGPLNATHPDTVRGILDFLKPIYKKTVVVAESTAGSGRSTLDGFENFKYTRIPREFKADFVDLNERPFTKMWIRGNEGFPLGINIIDDYTDPDTYVISATRLKSHNCVIATLSLKNIAMGSPVNHYKQKNPRGRNEKSNMHSGGNQGLSYNIFQLAKQGVRPDLAVLDGVVGMEGDGPVWGTPVEQGVVVSGTDWLACDRLGVELMGMDYNDILYLQWCANAGLGQDDLDKIQVVGPSWRSHVIEYRLHKNIAQQLEWVHQLREAQSS